MRLKDKVCIVTGAAQGIGFACAKRFYEDGAKVMLADIQVEKGEAAAASLTGGPGEASFIECDVRLKSSVDALIGATIHKWQRLDVMLLSRAIF